MRPLRLTLTNFMPFSNADLNLRDVSIAGISGSNGGGKSSLMEAFRFALFGRGRYDVGLRPDADKLIRDGEPAMEVRLEFEPSGGQGVHRVIRGRTRSGKSVFELQRWSGSTWAPITTSAARDTQRELRDLLRLDDRTWTASSLILQGDSNRFTTMDPAHRKEVLQQLLGLDLYPAMQKAARERYKVKGAEVIRIQERLHEISQGWEFTLGELEQRVEQAQQKIALLDKQAAELEGQRADLQQQTAALDGLRRRVADLEAEQVNQGTRFNQEGRDLEALKWKEIQAAAVAWEQKVKQASAELAGKLKDLADTQEFHRKQQEAARVRLERLREELERAERDLLPVAEELPERELALADLEQAEKRWHEQELRRRDLLGRLESHTASAGVLEQDPNCIDLPRAACRFLAGAKESQKAIPGLKTELAMIEELQKDRPTEQKLRALRLAVDASKRADQEIQRMPAVLEQKQKAEDDYTEWHSLIDRTEADYLELRERLARIEEEHAPKLEQRKQELLADFSERAEALGRRQQREHEALQLRYQTAQGELQILQQDLAGGRVEAQLQEVGRRLQETNQERDRTNQEVGHRRAQIAQRLQQAQQIEQLEGQLPELEAQRNTWDTLSRILDPRSGIPSEILKTFIPELQAEASQVLGRLTDQTMDLQISTLKQQKTAADKESLEIEVRHHGFIRPYEGLSGGQKFRVDFAIRLAISRALARRTGAQVQCLLIDEGFGSQDQQGRDLLLEVIDRVQADFGLILVITHFEELLDRLPARFEVVAGGAAGSSIRRIA